jgi:hypothetical protein
MKHLLYILLLTGFVSCVEPHERVEVTCVIDSVQYIGIGHNNSLQVSPYWSIHLKENDVWFRTNVKHEKGDTVKVKVKVFKIKPTYEQYP